MCTRTRQTSALSPNQINRQSRQKASLASSAALALLSPCQRLEVETSARATPLSALSAPLPGCPFVDQEDI